MRIEFESLKVTNFLSVGNETIEIVLNRSASTLVSGKNGNGKCLEKFSEIDIEISDEECLNDFKKFLR